MTLTELKVGDKITINWREIRAVAVVHKNGVTDDKGAKWTTHGRAWGGGGYGSSYAMVWKPDHDAIVAEHQRKHRESVLRNRVEDAARKVSLAALERIYEIIKEDQAGAPRS